MPVCVDMEMRLNFFASVSMELQRPLAASLHFAVLSMTLHPLAFIPDGPAPPDVCIAFFHIMSPVILSNITALVGV